MQRHLHDVHDVLVFAQGLIWFVFTGMATVAIALAAHLR
jgi:hypothetical protein